MNLDEYFFLNSQIKLKTFLLINFIENQRLSQKNLIFIGRFYFAFVIVQFSLHEPGTNKSLILMLAMRSNRKENAVPPVLTTSPNCVHANVVEELS